MNPTYIKVEQQYFINEDKLQELLGIPREEVINDIKVNFIANIIGREKPLQRIVIITTKKFIPPREL